MLDFICEHRILWFLSMCVITLIPCFVIGAVLAYFGAPVWVCVLAGMFVASQINK